ncbi:hypothetical protein FA15DRAFT_646974 [Coprinopsis marcescibilis]|uniref:C2H2-type domain-containing protein n=1 Tax=Coprinopsis marcescibilis TaxID=230819 RepID=A0A5C3KJS6_COPMA|nr:hypothetical protein FA15DRAFT_646974 [Coprinopsis marcescibilis]
MHSTQHRGKGNPSPLQISHQCDLCGRFFGGGGALSTHRQACRLQQKIRREKLKRKETEANSIKHAKEAAKATSFPVPNRPWENLLQRRRTTQVSSSTVPNPPSSPSLNVLAAPSQPIPSTSNSDPQTGSIRTTYPVSSGRAQEIISADDYREGTAPVPHQRNHDHAPWYPFETRADYEFAQLTLRSSLNRKEIGNLLSLFQRVAQKEDVLTLDNVTNLENTWTAASHLVTPFTCQDISLKFNEKEYMFQYWGRSVWDWIIDLVKNQLLRDKWDWSSKVMERFDGEDWVQFYTEPCTGSRFQDIEATLPSDGTPLGIILYADKTELSSFGTAKGYPVYAKIANLQSDVRNGKGLGGGQLVGWLPVVVDDTIEKGKPEYVDFKKVVWHESFKLVLETLKTPSKHGAWVQCADGVERRLFPFVVILSADYEEQVIMAGIRGIQNKKPCPVCLVNREDQATYFCDKDLKYRSGEESLKLVREAQTLSTNAAREIILNGTGLRAVENAFTTVENSDLHDALSFDKLHNYPGGLAKAHLVKLILDEFDANNAAIQGTRSLIEEWADKFPRWSGLIHFKTILSQTSFQDSNQWEDMSRVLLFLLHDIWIPANRQLRQLLRCLRSFLKLNVLASFETQTEKTLSMISLELENFFKQIAKYSKINPAKNWIIPKMHLHLHILRDIRMKGVTKHLSTKPFEGMHPGIKVLYMNSNFKNVAEQIMKKQQWGYALVYIETEVATYDKQQSSDEESNAPKYEFGRIVLRSPSFYRATPLSIFDFGLLVEDGPKNANIDKVDLEKEIHTFFRSRNTLIGYSLTSNSCIQAFKRLDVLFESKETWLSETNLLRCNPEFYGEPRYDAVIIQQDAGIMFARLLRLFVVFPTAEDKDISHGTPLALILPYNGAVTQSQRKKDLDLEFYHVRGTPQAHPEIVSAHTIIQGAVLTHTYDSSDTRSYFVFDVLDADMFLRVQELLNANRM